MGVRFSINDLRAGSVHPQARIHVNLTVDTLRVDLRKQRSNKRRAGDSKEI
jgi:hypothetical protein